MLKKVLYNKYKILGIPEKLPVDSEEFIKILFDLKNVVMFKYEDELRMTRYSGYEQDWLARATKFQPIPEAGGEVYNVVTLEDCVKYNENALNGGGSFSHTGYVLDDIEQYVYILKALDGCLVINSKQVYMPFIVKVANAQNASNLRQFMRKMFGDGFDKLVIDIKINDLGNGGTSIDVTNMQVFLDQIQNAKKKILDEAFMYLGVSSPEGKLAHQSEIEIEKASKVTDLIDFVMFEKIEKFINDCNKKFGLKMQIVKREI